MAKIVSRVRSYCGQRSRNNRALIPLSECSELASIFSAYAIGYARKCSSPKNRNLTSKFVTTFHCLTNLLNFYWNFYTESDFYTSLLMRTICFVCRGFFARNSLLCNGLNFPNEFIFQISNYFFWWKHQCMKGVNVVHFISVWKVRSFVFMQRVIQLK